ncbi:MAG: carbohydrate kinase family protein [Gammaproteobacteria bacterium]|nr:carbohydrate kinase family protein [Gammaproteobacteria bacterium]
MAFNYKIAVLGPIPRDHITTYRGEVIEKFGGVNNPVIALAKLLGEGSTVVPVTHVRKRDEQAIKDILSPYPNIDLSHIDSSQDQGDVIRLRFIDKNRRLEKQSGFMNPITPDDVKNLLDCDAFVIVPVTDFEVSLETLKFIKNYSNAKIIFDAHGPTNTMTTLGDRLLKFWVDRDSWLPYIDILKMNIEEAKCSWFRRRYKLPDLENDYEFGRADLPPFAKHCIDCGVKAVCITLDESGCVMYFGREGRMREKFVPAVPVKNVVDTAGCGDSFAGGLAFGYLLHDDFVKAAQYANILGAQRTQGSTFDVFKDYKTTEKMLHDVYGEEDK